MNGKPSTTVASLTMLLLAVACGDSPDELTSLRKGPDAPAAGDPNADAAQCTSRPYVGFGDEQLHGKRAVALVGADRGRIKPFSALQSEYERVLGTAPASLKGAGPTFGQVEKTWYEEPQSNAVALQKAFSIAFDGCLDYTAKPEFAAAPDATSAQTQCSAMARKFWSKTPGPEEIQACVDVATKGAAAEAQPQRRWAYACATVLSAAGFLTY